ncbi:hypothetical protein PMAYCL1PPCAC_01079, partial [Pristionchus mayeri]
MKPVLACDLKEFRTDLEERLAVLHLLEGRVRRAVADHVRSFKPGERCQLIHQRVRERVHLVVAAGGTVNGDEGESVVLSCVRNERGAEVSAVFGRREEIVHDSSWKGQFGRLRGSNREQHADLTLFIDSEPCALERILQVDARKHSISPCSCSRRPLQHLISDGQQDQAMSCRRRPQRQEQIA